MRSNFQPVVETSELTWSGDAMDAGHSHVAPAGQLFAAWTGNAAFAKASSPTTTFTMPSSTVAVTATYSPLPTYTLTVTNGTGSGGYAAGTSVTVSAHAALAGQRFATWTGNAVFSTPTSSTTTLTMPS